MGRPTLGRGETSHGFYNSSGKYKTRVAGIKTQACRLWENIRVRCQLLPKIEESRFRNYESVDIWEEWLDFQNFAEWFSTVPYYQDGWELDKDLLSDEHKIYSPHTCIFLPPELNKILNVKKSSRGNLPLGMSRHSDGKIDVSFRCQNPNFCVRVLVSDEDIHKGFSIYKSAREGYVRWLTEEYAELLDPRAYKILSDYKITIED